VTRGAKIVVRAVALGVVVAVHGNAVGGDALPPAGETLARASVPSETNKVGEVRLIRRGDATVVQTVLVTRLLARVTAEIRLKEEVNWPQSAAGHVDMLAYVEALQGAEAMLRAELPPVDARNVSDADRRLRLLIEFTASPGDAKVEIAEFSSPGDERPYDVVSRRPLAAPAVDRAYVLRNMRLILADAFHLQEADVDRLGPLGPAAAAP
jgi:hypothetical protein